MTERMLLFVDNSIDTFYSYRLPLALAAQKAGFQVHVAAPHGSCEQLIWDAGFIYHPLALTRRGANFLQEFASIAELLRLYRELKPNIVHHLRLKPVLYGGIAAHLAKVAGEVSMPTGLGYVFTATDTRARVMRRLTLWGCKFACRHGNMRVIFQNPDDQSIFTTSKTVSREKCVLIRGSGVDISEFVPGPEPQGTPVVILAARMLRDKGIIEFVEAAKILRSRGVKARFVLVGDTDPGNPTAVPAAELETWRDLGLVEWWGFRRDMEAVLAQANIVCLPSYREGVPKVLIEAAAVGRAIVTTDVPGCREIVRHGQNGLLVPIKDPVALAEAMQFLIENSGARARMGKKGRRIAVAEFSVDRVITETIEVYHTVLDKEQRRSPGRLPEAMKRSLDVVLSSVALAGTAPLLGAIAVAIKLTSPGPVFYRGVRIGRHNAPFHILKFRSMVTDAEKLGGSATAKDDRRITPIGKFLRRHKLDELPQLLNVLRGEMSLVGPRPEVKKYVDLYRGEEKDVLRLKPGITDWASIWNSNEGEALEGSPDPEKTYEQLIRPTKVALQLAYAREHSLGVDLRILFHTAMKLLRPGWIPAELTSYKPVERYLDVKKDMTNKNKVEQLERPAAAGGVPAFSQRFRFIAPTLPSLEDVIGAYRPAYQNGVITNAHCVERLEEAVAEYLGVKHCVAVSSCTSGLTLVIRALGLGGEIIIPSFTFFATGHAVRWNGLQPVLADCDRETWNINLADVESQITDKTSAILAVHMYGNPCEVEALSALAARHALKLIFDAAHAFGSKYRGRSIGQFGDAEVFSLSPTKLLVAGEGGLVTTNDAALARTLKALRNYGDTGSYNPQWVGANARMPEFNAALALSGLPGVEDKVKRRNEVAQMYTEQLQSLPGVRFQKINPEDVHTFKDYSIHIDPSGFGMSRDELGQSLLDENIETKKYFYPPLHKQDVYSRFNERVLSNTDYVADRILSLPIYESLPDSTIHQITNAIHRIRHYRIQSEQQKEEVIYAASEA